MGYIYELAETFTPQPFRRAVPGPVRGLNAVASHRGDLVLQWRAPAGSPVDFYRVERTREGRDYETVLTTATGWGCIKNSPWREPWFYGVIAVNARGAGRANLVWFFQRMGNNRSRLLPLAVVPGLRVQICELSAQ